MSKRILMLHASSDLYGASKIFFTSAQTLKEQGYEVIAALSEEGPLTDCLREAGIEVHIIRLGILRRKYFNISGMLNRVRVLKKATSVLKKLVYEQRIDMIYSQTAAVLVGAIVARATGKPHIWQVLEITNKPYWFYRGMCWAFNRFSDEVIVASDAVKDHWKKHVDEGKLTRIYYGVDSGDYLDAPSSLKSELGVSENHLVIGMIGRVHYWKGQDYFLRIAGRISREFPEVHFVMIGDAFPGYEYLYEDLNKIIREEGLQNKVTDLGFRRDIVNLLTGMDIFIQPSTLPDPFPTVILEAMAAAKPVIATSLGGAKEMIIHQDSGFLIPLSDPEEVLSIIRPLLRNKSKRTETGRKGRKRLNTYFSLSNYRSNFSEFIRHFFERQEHVK